MIFRLALEVFLTFTLFDEAETQCSDVKIWKKPPSCQERTLPRDNSFISLTVTHKLQCFKSCKTTNCLSVSYDTINRTCHQFDTIGDVCSGMVTEVNTLYYYKPVTCLNSGTPRVSYPETRCSCPAGIIGWICEDMPNDCQELVDRGASLVGVQTLKFAPEVPAVQLYCLREMAVLMFHSVSHAISFNRTWQEYVDGFTEDAQRQWLGLENLHLLTKYRPPQALYISVAVSVGGGGHYERVHFNDFKVGNATTNYTMTYSSHVLSVQHPGNILQGLNGSQFSTPDRDNDGNDTINCAEEFGAGWWLDGQNDCARSSPTSAFTCTGTCGPMATKQFLDRSEKFGRPVWIRMELKGME